LDPSMDVAHICLDLYALAEEKSMCGLQWSNDQYHDTLEPELYQGLAFYSLKYDEEHLNRYGAEARLIGEGRAEENCLTPHKHALESIFYDIDENGDLRIESTVYVAANGNVFHDCDSSFNRVDENAMGNVLHTSIEDLYRAVQSKAA